MLAVSKPEWDDDVPIEEEPYNCQFVEKRNEKVVWEDHVNQLELFYVQEMMELFHSSQMIAFYHNNPIADCNFRKAWQVSTFKSRLKHLLSIFNFRMVGGRGWN